MQVLVHSHNMAVVGILRAGRTKVDEVQYRVQELAVLCVHRQIDLRAVHIAGVRNAVAHELSRETCSVHSTRGGEPISMLFTLSTFVDVYLTVRTTTVEWAGRIAQRCGKGSTYTATTQRRSS